MSFWYGGDYNPEQWPSDVWDEDVRLMRRAGVTVATVGVFSWAQLEPRDGEFDFGWLDDILDRLHAGGIRVDLATATASPPAWLSLRHPDILPVSSDGVTAWPGSRQHYSPSSPAYRLHAARLVRALAERYAHHPALVAWHVGNEYANDNARDYGNAAAIAFRGWLRARYGDVEALNAAWGTAFWSQRYSEFDEVLPPRSTPTFGNPTHLLDFDRFSSDEHLASYMAEVEILRELSPHIPVTTNFMGFFRGLDYWKWAEHVDFVSDDSYPDPLDPLSHIDSAMHRDLMRSLGHGKPWILMEQSTSAVNWREVNAPRPPGQMRALSYQAIARGADGIMFFQWRQSVQGAEKFHSAMLPVQGTSHRTWREVEALGAELPLLENALGAAVEHVRVAIVMSWDSWWAFEQRATPARLDYIDGIREWYRGLFELGVLVDFVRATDDLAGYDLVIVPSLMVAGAAALSNLDQYTRSGGTLLVTYLTGITDEDLRFTAGGFLGELQKALGVRVDEFAPRNAPSLPTDRGPEITGTIEAAYAGFAEFITAHDAEVLAEFGSGALRGSPAITRRATADGAAWYVAAQLDAAGILRVLERCLDDAGIATSGIRPSTTTEVVRRGGLTFAINHGTAAVLLPLAGTALVGPAPQADGLRLAPREVAVLIARNCDSV
jgi:beta-galactosidase